MKLRQMQRERSALRTYQFLPIPTSEAGCRFRKVTRSEPGSSSIAQGTLGIYRYIEEMPVRLPIIFGLHLASPPPRTNTFVSRWLPLPPPQMPELPNIDSPFQIDASFCSCMPVNRDPMPGLRHQGWAIRLPHNQSAAAA